MLVLDCRGVNQLFRKPHRPEIAAAESIKRLQVSSDPEVQLYEAEADLKNCFYQCAVEAWLAEYSCFDDSVISSWAKSVGLTHDVHGVALCESQHLFPCLSL